MSAAGNPPQLQLSLGHQTFKRSFTQFGLDVDDSEDSRSDNGSASVGSGSSSGPGSSGRANANGSGSGSSGTRSVSSGSSYSSPGSVDLFGYDDGERSERNKRARSEGPEREDVSVGVSSASNSSAESLDAASLMSVSSSDVSILDSGSSSNSPPGEQGSPHQTDASISSFNTTSGFTLPALDFGPSTPSVAEFVALRSGSSNSRTAENPPGFANMLSPRSSSPVPPPAVEIDVAMHDDGSDEDPFPSLGPSQPDRQMPGANTSMSSGFLDTARSDARLNSATERLRSVMDRARTFDRTLAPLRSDAADSSTGSFPHQQSFSRPRLPPFDFESRRRTYHRAPESASSVADLSNPFDRLARPALNTSNATDLGGSTSEGRNLPIGGRTSTRARHSLVPISSPTQLDVGSDEETEVEEEEDSFIVDRELTLEPDLPDTGHSLANDSSSPSPETGPPSPVLRANTSRITGERNGVENSTNDLAQRIIGDLTSSMSSNETVDNARPTSFFDSSQLDPRLHNGETTETRANWPPRLDLGLTSPQLALEMSRQTDDLLSGLYDLDPPRSSPRQIPGWTAGRGRRQEEEARSGANIDRFRGWPWNDLLSPPATDFTIPGLGPRPNTEAQPRGGNIQQSPRLELRPHSPFFHLPALSSPGSNEGTNDAESDLRRIERMVEMDMETNAQTRTTSPIRRPPAHALREEDPTPSRLGAFRSAQNQNQAPRSSPARRPNLPTLRSAILGPMRSNDGEDGLSSVADLLRSEDWERIDMGTPQASTSGVAPSMTGSSLRSRALRSDQPTGRPPMLNLEGQSRDQATGGQRALPAASLDRRSDEGRILSPAGFRFLTNSSRGPMATGASQTASRFEPIRTPRERDREIAREASERNRQLLQNWFPPIYEEERIQESERRTRLREMREQHRLSVPSRPSLANRQERSAQLQAQTDSLDVLRWAHSWDEALQATAASSSIETDLFRPVRPSSNHPRAQPTSSNTIGNTQSSSTEAAAYFASGPSFGPSRQVPGRFSPSVLRRRSRIFSDYDEDRTVSIPELDIMREPWDDFEMNLDPSDTYGFGREHRPLNQSLRDFPIPTPSDELLQLLYSGPLNDSGSLQRQANPEANDLASVGRTSGHPNIDDLPPLEESQLRTWNSINIQRRIPPTNTSELPRRPPSQRNTSRPPSLPPLQFDSLSSLPGEDVSGRMFGIQEPSMHRITPWRRQQFDRQTDSPASNSLRNWRSGDLALHRAMILRSVQARQPARDTISGTSYNTPGSVSRTQGRTESSQQHRNAGGADASPRSARNISSYRDLNQGRSVLPTSNGTQNHVHWGEIRDDSSDSRPSANPAARPWPETSFRTRRRSLSSLFAPPPDNVDALPPNRTRGAGPAGGDPHVQAGPDWLEAISASRARSRQRARLTRFDNEPPRPFFRFGRNRPNLRSFGDFIRDEDFDTSYESLLALAQTLGEVKPRSTPAHVINALPTGLYKDWQSPESDTRCPICLDDYKDVDVLLKAEPCNHWCHKECFEQWLHTAQTCPVCRTKIKPSKLASTPPPAAGPSRLTRAEDMLDDSDDDYSFLSSSPNRAFFESMLPSGRPPRARPA